MTQPSSTEAKLVDKDDNPQCPDQLPAQTAPGAAVSGTAGASYTATEQTLINDCVTLINDLRLRVIELQDDNESMGWNADN